MSSTALHFPDGPVSEHAGTPYVMRGIELATSLVAGADPTRAPLPRRHAATSELPAVLENVLLRSLQRPPCVVAFSGGRDSGGLLAAAAGAARRHGLPLPIPATYRFPGVRDADENAWQDMVVRHIDLEDWVRIDITDELDLVGPGGCATPASPRAPVAAQQPFRGAARPPRERRARSSPASAEMSCWSPARTRLRGCCRAAGGLGWATRVASPPSSPPQGRVPGAPGAGSRHCRGSRRMRRPRTRGRALVNRSSRCGGARA